MNKAAFLSLCAVLAACGKTSSGMEDFCLASAEKEGKKITSEIQAHCKCVEKQMIAKFGQNATNDMIVELGGSVQNQENLKKSTGSVKDGFVSISYRCAIETHIAETMDLEDAAEVFVPMIHNIK
ncbi:MAG: hypothetical protein J5608_02355 [Alphaproteobacteria bacterium]|nr:hypothetical protein [Alphaproteobacteria bacterium]